MSTDRPSTPYERYKAAHRPRNAPLKRAVLTPTVRHMLAALCATLVLVNAELA